MVKCCAPLCGNASYRKLPDITFHRFPKDVNLKNAWLAKIGRKNWQPKPSSVFGSNHFEAHLVDFVLYWLLVQFQQFLTYLFKKRQFSSVLNPKGTQKGESVKEVKKLDDIFKTDLVKDKDSSEIQLIWEEYHRNKEVISATIPMKIYAELREKMIKYTTFIFPLPRSQGYEFIMSQCQRDTVHFTPLLAFQVHKENAPECLTMAHYTELQDKGIVLMRGEYDKNVLNGQEAQCLANQFQMYYSGCDVEKSKLLQNFTEHPDSFKHMDLISQLENISLV